jgi:peptide/nickel transport system permease protein
MSAMDAPIAVELNQVSGPPETRRLGYTRHYFRSNAGAVIGLIIVAVGVFLMLFGEAIAPYPPTKANPRDSLQPPSLAHLFGTDNAGMDIFSRVIAAPRIDITIGLLGTALALVIGCPIGVLLGFYRGWPSEIAMRLLDFVQSFPLFILAMALVSFTGQSITNVIYVVALLNVPIFARLVRAEALSLREREYVEAARCAGASDLKAIFTHLLPNALPPALIQSSVTVGWAILLTAGLSFIGAGVKIPEAEWGLMVSQGSTYMITGEWWIALFPGIAIGITVIGFALLGDALRELLDPTKRR